MVIELQKRSYFRTGTKQSYIKSLDCLPAKSGGHMLTLKLTMNLIRI